jgi:hypothetical protein
LTFALLISGSAVIVPQNKLPVCSQVKKNATDYNTAERNSKDIESSLVLLYFKLQLCELSSEVSNKPLQRLLLGTQLIPIYQPACTSLVRDTAAD